MREPYATLLAGYQDHWLIGPYVQGDEPDWEGLTDDDRLDALSSGEKVFLYILGAFAPGGWFDRLDSNHRLRVAQALLLTCESW